MLGGELAVLQASVFDGLALDPFALFEIGWGPAEVGVGWRHVVQALVVTLMVVVRDKGGDLGLEFAGQEVVFEQDEVLESLIVVAGGFKAERYFWPVAYTGRDGMTLEEVWVKEGARSYVGVTMPDFPNQFIIYGPNTQARSGGLFRLAGIVGALFARLAVVAGMAVRR